MEATGTKAEQESDIGTKRRREGEVFMMHFLLLRDSAECFFLWFL